MFRSYTRKYDMEEPPKLEEPIDEDGVRKRIVGANNEELEERYYK